MHFDSLFIWCYLEIREAPKLDLWDQGVKVEIYEIYETRAVIREGFSHILQAYVLLK